MPLDDLRRKLLSAVFKMPAVQTMVSRKSSITNAFVMSLIPVVFPTPEEIDEALAILAMQPENVRCAYCGNPCTEWDHLRPLVLKLRPTGFISEIANLVPACNKCNQSKRNEFWRTWMTSTTAPRSPTKLQIPDVAERIARLDLYERWRTPTQIDFEKVLGAEAWTEYWFRWERLNEQLKECQTFATTLKRQIDERLKEVADRGE